MHSHDRSHKFEIELKYGIIIVFLLIGRITTAQELNVGLEFTGGPKTNDSRIFSLGPTIEYRLKESIISINSGILFLVNKNEALVTFPVFIKFIIGKKFRVCPNAGGFVRSNKNYGWSSGLELDYRIKSQFILFVKGEYNQDYYKDEIPLHNGGSNETISTGSTVWLGLGIKINVL